MFGGCDGYSTRFDPFFHDMVWLYDCGFRFYDIANNRYIDLKSEFMTDPAGSKFNKIKTFPILADYENQRTIIAFSELVAQNIESIDPLKRDREIVSDLHYSESELWKRGITEAAIAPSDPDAIYLITAGVDDPNPGSALYLSPNLYGSSVGQGSGSRDFPNFVRLTDYLLESCLNPQVIFHHR